MSSFLGVMPVTVVLIAIEIIAIDSLTTCCYVSWTLALTNFYANIAVTDSQLNPADFT